MAFTSVITKNARSDIQEAITWYNDQQDELGKKFLKFVDKKINNLCVTPGIGSIRYDEVRCTMIKGFPYIIHYTVKKSSKQVIILRVLHAFRKPIW
jgi:plasmid stabilization system protein ParE